MANKKLHPSVEQFKTFVKVNPKIIQEVRIGKSSWQELFEEWYLLGEEDARWDNYRSEPIQAKEKSTDNANSSKSVWMSTVMDSIKNMDQNQLQGYIANLNQALGTIQGVISQFSAGGTTAKSSNKTSGEKKPSGPFSFRQD
ncbi:YlbD family protein [Niallia nealsonii]|uniref:Uncharacterized protein n=1 Tax=Niallia nealsonii TaxID=115979 RepID=A0A2N0YY18_9BACI|nr:YlbD family protein [Niallia nealsonii]PKG22154.1 hypothetical protein CWS01_18595 [Niallia nealsonii]